MDSIDKLLAEIKTEYTEPQATPKPNNLTPVKLDLPVTKADVLIDNLLSEVQAEVAENKIPDIQYQPTSYYHLPPIEFIHSPANKSDVFMDNLLADVKADIKVLMAQSNIDKTRIDNLERRVNNLEVSIYVKSSQQKTTTLSQGASKYFIKEEELDINKYLRKRV